MLASQHVVDHIKQTKDAFKLAYWGPILGNRRPKTLIRDLAS